MTYDQALDLIERHAEDNGQNALQEWLELEADREAEQAWIEERP